LEILYEANQQQQGEVLANRSAHQINKSFLDGVDRFPMGLQEVLCMFLPVIEFFLMVPSSPIEKLSTSHVDPSR
jgi:hypothetical protein